MNIQDGIGVFDIHETAASANSIWRRHYIRRKPTTYSLNCSNADETESFTESESDNDEDWNAHCNEKSRKPEDSKPNDQDYEGKKDTEKKSFKSSMRPNRFSEKNSNLLREYYQYYESQGYKVDAVTKQLEEIQHQLCFARKGQISPIEFFSQKKIWNAHDISFTRGFHYILLIRFSCYTELTNFVL